jgi:acyl-CoA thioester hydrolase
MTGAPESSLTEVQRGTVGAWQCDSNGHWNARYYCNQFDLAARVAANLGGAAMSAPPPVWRHLRFHAELLGGDIFRIETGRIVDGTHAGSLVHMMYHAGVGKLIATALDAPCDAGQQAAVAPVSGQQAQAALPRSVANEQAPVIDRQQMLDSGAFVTGRYWVQPVHCTPDKTLSELELAGIFADAAGHVWDRAGAGVVWLRENGLGRAAVEFRIERQAQARLGDLLVLMSRVGPVQGKAIRLQHQLYRLPDHEPIAGAEVVAMLIDMGTRRSVPMPDFLDPAAAGGAHGA